MRKWSPGLELDITIMADVCLLPRLEHLGMALVEGRKYFSQMMMGLMALSPLCFPVLKKRKRIVKF